MVLCCCYVTLWGGESSQNLTTVLTIADLGFVPVSAITEQQEPSLELYQALVLVPVGLQRIPMRQNIASIEGEK